MDKHLLQPSSRRAFFGIAFSPIAFSLIFAAGFGFFAAPAHATCTGLGSANINCTGTDAITPAPATYSGGNVINILHDWTLTGSGGFYSSATGATATNTLTATNVSINNTLTIGNVRGISIASNNGDVSLDVTSGTITTKGNAGFAIYGTTAGGGDVSITNGANVTTAGDVLSGTPTYAVFAWVSGGNGTASITNSGDVSTAGVGAAGLYAFTNGGSTTIDNSGTIITNGNASGSTGAYGIIAVGASGSGNVVSITNRGTITTYGDAAAAIYGISAGAAAINIINSGDLTTYGDFASGNIGAYGIEAYAQGSGIITITNSGTIATFGELDQGIHAAATSGSITITNGGMITTSGTNADGIYATISSGSGTINITNNAAIATSGGSAAGIVGNVAGGNGSVIITNNATITTSQTSSYGIESSITSGSGAATITNNAAITTTANSAIGIYSYTNSNGATNITNNAAITTSGNSAYGIFANVPGISATSITNTAAITTSGSSAHGLDVFSTSNKSTVTLNNSGSVVSGQANAVRVTGGTTGLQLTNSGAILGGSVGVYFSGNHLSAKIDNSGTIGSLNDFAVDTHLLTTAFTINNPGTITGYMTLGNNANTLNNSGLWNLRNYNAPTNTQSVAVSDFGLSDSNVINNTGTLQLTAVNGAAVNATGAYLPLGNAFNTPSAGGSVQGKIVNVLTFNHSGVIDLTANGAVGDVLLISSSSAAGAGDSVFVSNGGTLKINTVLNEGGANSKSDMLVLDSTQLGSAPTRIIVTNVGGLGAQTPGNGIAVVEVLNKTASADGVFALGAPAAAGAYDYGLFHHGIGADAADGNWYLRLTGIRPEVPLDTAVPALTMRVGLATLGTYTHRTGDTGAGANLRPVCEISDEQQQGCDRLFWMRAFGANGTFEKRNRHGDNPAYDFGYFGLQLGVNLYRDDNDQAGIYGGVTSLDGDVRDFNGGRAGQVNVENYSMGAYWTHRDSQGWYTDLVAQVDRYSDISTDSGRQQFHTDGWGYSVSIEAGRGFDLDDEQRLRLIPQGQLVYQHAEIDDGADDYGRINYATNDILFGRLGAKLAHDSETGTLTFWTEMNLWHQFGSDAKTTFSTLEKTNAVSFNASLGGTWAQLGAGLSGRLGKNTNLFGMADYNTALGQGHGHSIEGRIGIRVTW
ncbi:MAG: autotransporter domain-containing protein [Methylobacillus sp.]|jgi:autotransporter family porin|nr:autotransporter domain-containing protein [Methylobacillus sp.]